MSWEAIHDAAKDCDVEALRRELERGVDPNLAWNHGKPPLRFLPTQLEMSSFFVNASEMSERDWRALHCFRLLIENGASVHHVSDSFDTTYLHSACLNNNVELVKLLLEAGSDITARSRRGNTPLHSAALLGGTESARLLLRAGADVNVENNFGVTPLVFSLNGGYPRGFRIWPILLRAGANLPAETDYPTNSGPYDAKRYIQKVVDAGGWAKYERFHLDKLTAMLTPKDQTDGRRRSRRRLSPLRRLPAEVLRRIVAYAFHAGYY